MDLTGLAGDEERKGAAGVLDVGDQVSGDATHILRRYRKLNSLGAGLEFHCGHAECVMPKDNQRCPTSREPDAQVVRREVLALDRNLRASAIGEEKNPQGENIEKGWGDKTEQQAIRA